MARSRFCTLGAKSGAGGTVASTGVFQVLSFLGFFPLPLGSRCHCSKLSHSSCDVVARCRMPPPSPRPASIAPPHVRPKPSLPLSSLSLSHTYTHTHVPSLNLSPCLSLSMPLNLTPCLSLSLNPSLPLPLCRSLLPLSLVDCPSLSLAGWVVEGGPSTLAREKARGRKDTEEDDRVVRGRQEKRDAWLLGIGSPCASRSIPLAPSLSILPLFPFIHPSTLHPSIPIHFNSSQFIHPSQSISPSIHLHPFQFISIHFHSSQFIHPSISIHSSQSIHLNQSVHPSISLLCSALSITIPIPNIRMHTCTWICIPLVLFVVDLRLARASHPLRRTTKHPRIPRLTRPRLPRRRTHACGRVEEVGATGWKACWKRREPCSMRPRRVPCHRSKCTPPCGGWRRNAWCIQKHTSPWQERRAQEGRGGSCSRPAPSKSETKCVAKDVVVARTFHSWRDSNGIQNDA